MTVQDVEETYDQLRTVIGLIARASLVDISREVIIYARTVLNSRHTWDHCVPTIHRHQRRQPVFRFWNKHHHNTRRPPLVHIGL